MRTHVERLVTAGIIGNAIPHDTAEWLRGLPGKLYVRPAAVGSAERRETATLKAFIDHYRGTRADWSKGMRAQFDLATSDAERFFGADRWLDTITAADADAFRASLAVSLSAETVHKRLRLIKHVFRVAVRSKLLREDPFADQRAANHGNRERMQYIPMDTVSTVADELTGDHRLILLLARFAGLRIQSEANALRWPYVDFGRETLLIFSRETGASRTVPMLPLLRDDLLKAFERCPERAEFVIQRRQPLPPIRRAVELAIERAGLAAVVSAVTGELRDRLFPDVARARGRGDSRAFRQDRGRALLDH